jgi:hypothetical protein
MKHTLLSLVAMASLLAPVSASAEEEVGREVIFGMGAKFELIKDAAFDYFSEDDWLTSGLLSVEVEAASDLFVGLGLGFATREAWLWDKYQTTLSYTEPQILVRKAFAVSDWMRPYASLAGTYAWTTTTVALWGNTEITREDGWGEGRFGGRAAAGLELCVPRSVFREGDTATGFFKDMSMGVTFEAGYGIKQPVDLSDLPVSGSSAGEGLDAMPQASPDLGELWLQGFYMAFDFRFYL